MTDPIKRIRIYAHQFSLELSCGMAISYPYVWFSKLKNAQTEDLKKYKIHDRTVIWTALDFKISLPELLEIYWEANKLNGKGIIKSMN